MHKSTTLSHFKTLKITAVEYTDVDVNAITSRAMREVMVATVLNQNGIHPNEKLGRKYYRQTLCFCLLVAGQTREQCAELLDVHVDTVKKHEQRFRERLQARSRLQAYHLARRQQLILEDFISQN